MKAVGRITPSESLQDFKWDWWPVKIHERIDQRFHGLIPPFLQRIRCILKRLEISSVPLLEADFDFPNLKHLEILLKNACYSVSLFSSRKFPRLETYGFEFDSGISGANNFQCDFVHENVTSLKIGFGTDLGSFRIRLPILQDALQRLSVALPNVEALSVHIGIDWVKYKNAKEVSYLIHHNFPGIKRLRVGEWCNRTLLIGRYYFSYKIAHALGITSYDWSENDRDIDSNGEKENDSDYDNDEDSQEEATRIGVSVECLDKWKFTPKFGFGESSDGPFENDCDNDESDVESDDESEEERLGEKTNVESEDDLSDVSENEDKSGSEASLEDTADANVRGGEKEGPRRIEDAVDRRLSEPRIGKFRFGLGVTHFRELEELRFDCVQDYRPYNYNGRYEHIFRWVTPQKEKKIEMEVWKRCLAKLPKLKVLILGNCEDYKIDCEEEFVQVLPQLRVMTAPY